MFLKLILPLAGFLWLGAGPAQGDIPCKLGDSMTSVVTSILGESGGMLYRNELSAIRYAVTWKPFGIYAIRYTCVVEDDEVVYVQQRIGSWTSPNKAAGDVRKGNGEVARYLKGIATSRKAKKTESEHGRTVYGFGNEDSRGQIVLNTAPRVSGQVVEYSDARLSTYQPEAREGMWFGTAVAQGDSITRDERTTSIPYRVGQWFAWSVQTGLDDPAEVSLALHYPGDAEVVGKSPQVETSPSTRTVEFPFGPRSGEFSVELQVEEGDPSGLYRAYLLVEGTRLAGIAYELKAE